MARFASLQTVDLIVRHCGSEKDTIVKVLTEGTHRMYPLKIPKPTEDADRQCFRCTDSIGVQATWTNLEPKGIHNNNEIRVRIEDATVSNAEFSASKWLIW